MKTVRSIAVFLIALSLTAWALQIVRKPHEIMTVTPKVNYMTERGDEFDVVFIGSSRTYRQVLPEIFDRTMTEAGLPVRSFNLGVDGMRPPEDTYVLEQALAARRKPVKWVFLESNVLRIEPRDEDRDTDRVMYWHDWPRYKVIVQRAFFSDPKKRDFDGRWREIKKAWPDFADHTRYFFQRATALGSGHDAFDDWLFRRPPPKPAAWALGTRKDGYSPASVPEQMSPDVLAAYEKELAESMVEPPKPVTGDRATLADLAIKRKLVEKHGGKLVLFVAPFAANSVFVPKGPENVLDFSDPKRFPELYEPRHRADRGHVNTAGARIFTELLAREFLASRPK
jgi:hypothetical protein